MLELILTIGFFVASFISSFAGVLGLTFAWYWKGLPLAILIFDIGRGVIAGDRSRLRLFIWIGLIFSLVADLVIMESFIGGLIFFLIAHVMYIAAMGVGPGNAAQRAKAIAPAAVYLLFMLAIIVPKVPSDLLIPVVIYSTIITSMLALATLRAFVAVKDAYARLLWFGALLFVISDSMIAINRWVVDDMRYAGIVILVTYYTGQWFISRGVRVQRTTAQG